MLYSLTTEDAEWFKERISLIIGLAPVARLDNIETTLLKILGSSNAAINLVKMFGKKEWFSENLWTKSFFQKLCSKFPKISETNMKFITDGDPDVNDREVFKLYMRHFPGGLSVKLLEHELQIYRAQRFQLFDYGKDKNKEIYGEEIPPIIPVEKITGISIAMMVGNSDLLGDVKDNEWLRDQIQQNIVSYKVYDYGCSSFYNAKDMCYLDEMKSLLSQFSEPKIKKDVTSVNQ